MKGFLVLGGATLLAALGVGAYVERRRLAPVGNAIVDKMVSLLGTPYLWGGKDIAHGGLDCSGAVTYVLQALGAVPKGFVRNADELYHMAEKVLVPQAGDLAFYGSALDVTHVMVVTGDGRVVGATGGGPATKTTEIARAQGAQIKYEPVNYRKDLVAYGRLPMLIA